MLEGTTDIPNDVLDRVMHDLGPVAPAFMHRDDVFITGGYLTRLACGLAIGADIDVVCHVDGHAAVRGLLLGEGYKLSPNATSTGFVEDRTDGVWFRQKWEHPDPDRLSFDCLVLETSDYTPDAPDTVDAAVEFLDTYDCYVSRQLFGWQEGRPVWFRTPESEACVREHRPGWTDGAHPTTDERRARWDALLPGLPDPL